MKFFVTRAIFYFSFFQIAFRKNIFVNAGSSLVPCNETKPLNMSKDICGDMCQKGAVCSESGACICAKEPGASMLGGHPTHCTNWNYVEQEECASKCSMAGKNDHRVCWTFTIGNYCTCFDKIIQPTMSIV